MLKKYLWGLALLHLAACSDPAQNSAGRDQAPMDSAGLQSGLNLEYFDRGIHPGDDFYRFVNGNWLRNTEIPADKSNYGAFIQLDDEARENLRVLIESAAAAPVPPGSEQQKVGDFYNSFMDEERLEALGPLPLASLLTDLAAADSKEELLRISADLNWIGVQIPTAFYINNDEKQSDQYITYITQSGLGLPDRDWYLSTDDPSHDTARNAYQTYISQVLSMADYPRSSAATDSVMAIETRIAAAHWDRVRNRQAELTYNKLSLAELVELAPGLDWPVLLSGLGVQEEVFVVSQPSFLQDYAGIWDEMPLENWIDYFAFKTIDAFAPYLSQAFVEAQFDFKGRVLSGSQELEPRWRRGVSVVDIALGEVVGKLYVDNFFQEAAKQRMDHLIENLREAFRVGINELEWMTPETKLRAQEKLASFSTKIGYPDEWKDYSALVVDRNDLVGNVMRSRRLEHARELAKLGQSIDRGEWFMTPHTVNAYYNPGMNEIVFPAAILQPPFFNVEADDAVNYGAIGAVIGHEFSHGFDDQGRKYDGNGNLDDWWTEADAAAFNARAERIVAQYNAIEVLPGKFLNGEFTLGENIGDISGLAVAYKAYQMSLEGREAPVIAGFTGDQRFFIGWAQGWRRLYRDENLEVRLTSDSHSHSEARTNQVVRNFDAWHDAFNVGENAALYLPPEERVKIW
jgi:putative endopeptidase